ncbi:MAG: hypothetical protein AMJ54_08620 [Deltaproteobacteria bacterium SG8_13]|nr:MAG: hypothetical protein AMJ54_08620 [Deltaproteobacteria bacterium SG8_13]
MDPAPGGRIHHLEKTKRTGSSCDPNELAGWILVSGFLPDQFIRYHRIEPVRCPPCPADCRPCNRVVLLWETGFYTLVFPPGPAGFYDTPSNASSNPNRWAAQIGVNRTGSRIAASGRRLRVRRGKHH